MTVVAVLLLLMLLMLLLLLLLLMLLLLMLLLLLWLLLNMLHRGRSSAASLRRLHLALWLSIRCNQPRHCKGVPRRCAANEPLFKWERLCCENEHEAAV